MSGVETEPGRIYRITLDRADRRNALDAAMLDALGAALAAAAADGSARCILLAGRGDHFCAGADFGDVTSSAAGGVRYGGAFEDLLAAIEDHPLPVVAGVHGAALGAGCQILAACDLAVAATDARIGIPSARLGLLLDLEKVQRIVRVWGVQPARQMLLSAREYSGAEAASEGLVTKAVAPATVDAESEALCERVAAASPLSVRGSKTAIRAILRSSGLRRDGDAAVFAEHDARSVEALQSSDLREGLAALRERRAPRFEGR